MEQYPAEASSARVLILEENAAPLRTLSAVLRDEGFEVTACATAAEAVERLAQDRFDVGIIDLALGDLANDEWLDRLREASDRVSLIIHTARASYNLAKRAINLGAFAYVENGTDPRELLGHVHRALLARLKRRSADIEQRLELALAASHTGVWEWNVRTGAVYWSPQCFEILGVEGFAGTLESFTDLLHPEDADRVMAAADRALADHSNYTAEFRVLLPDGRMRWLSNMGRGEYDKTGRPLRLVGTVQDITERKRLEQSLRSEKELAQQYFDVAGVIMLALDPSGNVALVNRKGCEILGYEEEDILGKNWFDHFLPARVRAGVRDVFCRIVNGDLAADEYAENVVLCRGGEERLIAWHNTLVRDESGRITGVLSSGEDITARRRAEEAAARQQQRFEQILSSFPFGIVIVDRDHRVEYANPPLRREFGQTDGRKCHDYFHGLSEPCPWCTNDRVFRGEVVQWDWHSPRNGRDYELFDIPLRNDDGTTSKMEVFHDVTERKRTEKELASALAEARQRQLETAALLKAARAVLECAGFKTAAQAVFDACKEAIGATAGYVALLSAQGTENEVLFLDAGGRACTVDPALPMPIRGLRSEAYRTGKVVYENRFAASRWQDYMPEGHVDLDNVLFAPLVVGGAAVGLLGLANKSGGFTEHDAEIAGAFGELAAIALRSARAEESLAEATQRLTMALRAGNIGLWDWNLVTGAVVLSPEWKAQIGFREDEIEDSVEAWEGRLARADRERVLEAQRAYLDGRRRRYATEFRLRHKNGSYRWIYTKGEAVRDEHGRPVRLLGCHVDITDRKRAEMDLALAHAELRRSEAWFRSLIELSASIYTVVGLDGTIRYQSPSTERWYGWKPDELLGRDVFDLIHPEDVARAKAGLAKILEGPGAVNVEELRSLHKDGSWRWARVVGVNRLDNPAVSGIVLTSQDVTDLKRAETELARAKDAAEAANRAKSEFLANMSHEIRTPMTAITGFTELLLSKDRPPDEQREYLAIIQRNAQNLLAIINDILDLSKIEAERVEVEIMDCSAREVVEEVIALLGEKAGGKGLSLDVSYVEPLPPTIRTDPGKLRQILVNLVGNAIKFTDAGGVRVSVRRVSGNGARPQVQFEVADTGVGISAEGLEDLFEPFTQADMSSTRRFGGTGLGLSISRRLAEMLGGKIDVASELGRGSTFTLTIDAGVEESITREAPRTAQRPAAADVCPAYQGRVLLAEDAPDMAKLIQRILETAELALDVAETGLAAYEKAMASQAAGAPYDLILMDIRMPVMDGYEATRRLRAHGWKGPIVALTANSMRGDREKCLAAGCDDFLAKPVSRAAFFGVLERCLVRKDKAADAPPAPSPLDPRAEAKLFDGLLDDATVAALVEEYAATLYLKAEALITALAARDLELLAGLAHELKGVAAMYGFAGVSEKARSLQSLAQRADELAQVEATVRELIELCRTAAEAGRKDSGRPPEPASDAPPPSRGRGDHHHGPAPVP